MAEAELEKRPSEIIPQVSTAPAEPDPKRAKIEVILNKKQTIGYILPIVRVN